MGNRAIKTRRKRKVSLIKGLQDSDILTELETLAAQSGLEIRNEKGDFKSGFCTVKDQNMIILKKDDLVQNKIHIIAEKLTEVEFEKSTLNPAIIDFINQKKNDRESLLGPEEE